MNTPKNQIDADNLAPPEPQITIDQKILTERVRILYQQTLVAIPSGLLCATIILFGLYPTDNTPQLWGWYAAVVILSLLRLGLYGFYRYVQVSVKVSFHLFLGSIISSALLWGFMGSWLIPSSTLLDQVIVIVVIAGLTAGVQQSLQPSFLAYTLFASIAILPLVTWLFFQEGDTHSVLSAVVLIYLLAMLVMARRGAMLLIKALRLQYENAGLVEDLSTANAQLMTMNQTLKQAEQQLKDIAYHDSLTGLPNRQLLEISSDVALKYAIRHQQMLAILFLDLDYFKDINDNFGHEAGDALLKTIAERLQNSLRKTDLACRLGGDEFVVMLTEVSDEPAIILCANRILYAIAKPITIDGNTIDITASMGISVFPNDGFDIQTLLSHADKALYRMKEEGRRDFKFYSGDMG